MRYYSLCLYRSSYLYLHFFFFFQAEDGIRDLTVTGVQTCALPISQAISQFAGAVLLAGLRPPIFDPDAGRLVRCVAPTFREEILPLSVLQRPVVLAYQLRLDGVSRDDLLVAVHHEDIGVLPHPRTLLLVKRCQVTRLRQSAGRFPYLCDDLLSCCLVLPHGDGGDKRSRRQNNEDLAVLHTLSPFAHPTSLGSSRTCRTSPDRRARLLSRRHRSSVCARRGSARNRLHRPASLQHRP